MAMTTKKKWIIGGAVALAIIIVIYFSTNQTAPVDKAIIQGADLSKLSPQDLAEYNSLPNDAAKADFLKILVGSNKIPDFGIKAIEQKANAGNPNAKVNTPPATTQGYDSTKPNYKPDAVIPPLTNPTGIPVIDKLINLFRKPHYKQVRPIDPSGCDANGYDNRGVSCTTVSGYTQVGTVDDRGCDADNRDVIGVPCL